MARAQRPNILHNAHRLVRVDGLKLLLICAAHSEQQIHHALRGDHVRKITSFCGLLLLALPALGPAQQAAAPALPRTASPDGAMVYFLAPANGATVTSPVTVRFGLRGMGVA